MQFIDLGAQRERIADRLKSAIERVIELEPQRGENTRLLALVDEVAAGRRPCPRNEADILKALS